MKTLGIPALVAAIGAAVTLASGGALAGGLCYYADECGSRNDVCELWNCYRPYPESPGLCQRAGFLNCDDGNPATHDSCVSVDGIGCVHRFPTATPTQVPTPSPVPEAVGRPIGRIAITCSASSLPPEYRRYCSGGCSRRAGLENPLVCSTGGGGTVSCPASGGPDGIVACCTIGCSVTSCRTAAYDVGFRDPCITTRAEIVHVGGDLPYDYVYCAVYRTSACPTPIPCAGDCNADEKVVVNELVRAVGIALGQGEAAECSPVDRNGDGSVSVNELIAAVGSALNGCAS